MATILKGKNPSKPWTVRYRHEGKQHERSFRTSREANDFKIKFEHDQREHIFADPAAGREHFSQTAARWLAASTANANSKRRYQTALANHVYPLIGRKSLTSVATDREAMVELLTVTLPERNLGPSSINNIYMIIRAIVNDAIRNRRIMSSRINGIKLPPSVYRANIIFPAYQQLETIADELDERGIAIWLMRGCGLRIGEVMGLLPENLRDGYIRLTSQIDQYGKRQPLKHRKQDAFRDVPLPDYVADKLALTPIHEAQPVVPKMSRSRFNKRFELARDKAGLPKSFTPHSLRHVFASVALANGIPITDVSKWLGHRDINVTFAIYGHLVPSSLANARHVLDAEYESWSEQKGDAS